ncbi:MAG: hypothetical protein DME26_09325 [Verrucomicrobia bacterium]|nr:MAG: hypothetical protein DME26_09325 [Verrucomicrobiota bacterium]
MSSAEPHIDRIERYGTNQVTIHFDTDANRTYELQYLANSTCPTNGLGTNSSGCGGNTTIVGTWSNLFVAPSIPFANHYVILDTMRNQIGFYRLRVTP